MSRIALILEDSSPDLAGREVVGHILADLEVREALDALAEACQIRPLGAFFDVGGSVPPLLLFGRPSPTDSIRWHDPAAGLQTFRTLAAGLLATLDGPTAVAKGLDDLERFAQALEAAAHRGTRFHLVDQD